MRRRHIQRQCRQRLLPILGLQAPTRHGSGAALGAFGVLGLYDVVGRQVAGTAAALALDAAKGDVGAVPYAGLRKRLAGQFQLPHLRSGQQRLWPYNIRALTTLKCRL